MMIEAGIAVRRDDADLATAATAGQKAGKEMDGTTCLAYALHAAFQGIGWIGAEDFRYLLLPRTGGVP